MNYLDLFSGIGGFHLGLLQAGFKFDWCGHSEIDKYAKKVYHKHFPESEDLGDVREIEVGYKSIREGVGEQSREKQNILSNRDYENFTVRDNRLFHSEWESRRNTTTITTANGTHTNNGRIDLITFGFPCQDLSVAGKRGGLSAKRSGLFFEAMRIIESAKPEIFIFENVKGLLSSNSGQDFLTVLRTIADLGIYECEWQLVNTRWVLPQNRERIYFIGHLRGTGGQKVFPIGEGSTGVIQGANDTTSVRCLQGGGHSGGHHSGMTLLKTFHEYEKGKRIIKTAPSEVFNCLRGSGEKDSSCGGKLKGIGFQDSNLSIRRLTPVECARLQGFPDTWCSDLSDSQSYKCYGNAVTVPIVKMIAERLIKQENA